MLRRLLRWFIPALATFAAFAAFVTPAAADVPKPVIIIAKPGSKCLAPPAVMRRTHMSMLLHQREKTLRLGERGAKVSLEGCIECHANKTNDSVLGTNQNFCQTCHAYVAVKIDCFECHQPSTGMVKTAGSKP
ncbi:MAG TPA: hypothetical protein VMV33_07940 [Rhodocyclaceae bacterium]|nr:hypothetical protein [Rhodocyclaceae bacterium]